MVLETCSDGKKRCFGGDPEQDIMGRYHDEEWGVPVHDDKVLFEFLILEGAQAGLSWNTVLKRREGYRKAFFGFDPVKAAAMTDGELEALRGDSSIIRNKLKIYSVRKNALVFIQIQKEFGSFSEFLWAFVGGAPIVNRWSDFSQFPVTTPVSDALSKDFKSGE